MSSDRPEPPEPAAKSDLVVADDLRVDVDGVPACDGLTLRTAGRRCLVLGAPRVLFEAVGARRPVARGSLTIAGTPAERAVHDRVVAVASLDPAMPPKWTPLEYVTWSARLAGHGARDARTLASAAVERVELGDMAKTVLGKQVLHARRATVLAAAIATGAEIVALEDPLAALPEETGRVFARIVVDALAGRPWVVFAPRVPLTSPLVLAADDAIVVSGSSVEVQGRPAVLAGKERRLVARIHGPLEALGTMLAARGGRLEVQGAQVVVDLGEELRTSELLGLCLAAGVTLVEMHSTSRAFA